MEINENTEVCKNCGGRCCKKSGCDYWPSDLPDKTYKGILKFLENIDSNNFLDSKFQILRSHPMQRDILGIDFYCSEVKYPLLVHKFGNFDILIEVIIKEKQRAIGVQPMLYICFPITELKPEGNKPSLLGRVADSCAYFILNSKDKQFLLQSFKIFGILSESHNYDIRRILELIKNYIQ